jgi:hypothetical protein
MASMAETIIARKKGRKQPGMDAINADDSEDAAMADSGPDGEETMDVGADEGNTAEDAEAKALDGGGDEGDMGDYESIEDSASADMMQATKTGDREMFKTALRDFVKACMARGGSEE